MTPSVTSDRPQETPEGFLPTPERLSSLSFLEWKLEEVHELLVSAEGRKKILERILEHASSMQKLYPGFDPAALPHQLEMVSRVYQEKERFLEAAEKPEKAGMFRRAWDAIRSFPKKHPFVLMLLILALLAGGAAYLGHLRIPGLGGWWGEWKGKLGLGTVPAKEGAAEAAGAVEAVGKDVLPLAHTLVTDPNDLAVVGHQIFFRGAAYDLKNLEPLAKVLKEAGIQDLETVRILRHPSARFTAWQQLRRFLVDEAGVDGDKIVLPKDLLPE